MKRREFLISASSMFFSALVAASFGVPRRVIPEEITDWQASNPLSKDGPAPLPEITAVTDIMVPADPEIPNDFKGSDYGGDWVLAATLGTAGQIVAVAFLNKYAKQVNGKSFMECTDDERMEALKQWIRERDGLSDTFNEMLTGILTISVIGTYEVEDPDLSRELFTSMNWFDPKDPTGTFRIPCEGYVDARMFPIRLKKGLQDE